MARLIENTGNLISSLDEVEPWTEILVHKASTEHLKFGPQGEDRTFEFGAQ